MGRSLMSFRCLLSCGLGKGDLATASLKSLNSFCQFSLHIHFVIFFTVSTFCHFASTNHVVLLRIIRLSGNFSIPFLLSAVRVLQSFLLLSFILRPFPSFDIRCSHHINVLLQNTVVGDLDVKHLFSFFFKYCS